LSTVVVLTNKLANTGEYITSFNCLG